MKNLFYPLLFIAFGLYLLLGGIPDFLLETADMTPFSTSSHHISETIGNAGGVLTLCSQWLTSCFAIPWLGTVLLVGILVALAYAIRLTFRLPSALEGLCWLPSLAMLLNYSQQGYMLYVMKVAGTAFSMPLGLIIGIGLYAAYLHIKPIWGRLAWILITALPLYYIIGAYAFLPLVLTAIHELIKAGSTKDKTSAILSAITIAAAAASPWLLYICGAIRRASNTLYTAGLPDYLWNETERPLWTPYIFAATLILVLSIIPNWERLTSSKKSKTVTNICGIVLMLLGMAYVYTHTFTDENYRCILQMKRAAEKGEWEEVLKTSAECESTPTRLQVLYTRLALHKLGRGGNELFRYRDGDTPYNVQRPHQYLRLIGGRSLYYYYGKTNYSYRWCMEDMVEYGKRPDYIRYMLKCAIFNQELPLARKYLELLRTMPFQGEFVSKYESYIEQPELKDSDAEMQEITKLTNYANLLDGDGGLIEVYLLNSFALMEGGTREMVDLSLQSCLILKDLSGFWQRFIKLLPTFKDGKIPTHYQEAALLLAAFNANLDLSGLPIDKNIQTKFNQLVEASEKNSKLGEDYNRNALYPQYGNTYWYYYFFVKGLKTN